MLRRAVRTLGAAAAPLTGRGAGDPASAFKAAAAATLALSSRSAACPNTGAPAAGWAGLAGLHHARRFSSSNSSSNKQPPSRGGDDNSSSSSSSSSSSNGGETRGGDGNGGAGTAAKAPDVAKPGTHHHKQQHQQQHPQQQDPAHQFDEWEDRARTSRRAATAARPPVPAASASDYGRWSAAPITGSDGSTEGGIDDVLDEGSCGMGPSSNTGTAAMARGGHGALRPGPRSEAAVPASNGSSGSGGSSSSGGGGASSSRSVGASSGARVEWTMAAAAAAAASWTSRGGPRPGAAPGPGAPGGGPGAGMPVRLVQRSGGVETVVSVAGKAPADYEIELVRRNALPAADDPARAGKRGGLQGGAPAARSNALQLALRRTYKQLQNTFLPSGYPGSVGPHYLQYSLWQAGTNFATTANGVLASTFLLYSVGLGAGAIPTAGALNWVVKDGLGQVGGVLRGGGVWGGLNAGLSQVVCWAAGSYCGITDHPLLFPASRSWARCCLARPSPTTLTSTPKAGTSCPSSSSARRQVRLPPPPTLNLCINYHPALLQRPCAAPSTTYKNIKPRCLPPQAWRSRPSSSPTPSSSWAAAPT
jgi:hypothetical protein